MRCCMHHCGVCAAAARCRLLLSGEAAVCEQGMCVEHLCKACVIPPDTPLRGCSLLYHPAATSIAETRMLIGRFSTAGCGLVSGLMASSCCASVVDAHCRAVRRCMFCCGLWGVLLGFRHHRRVFCVPGPLSVLLLWGHPFNCVGSDGNSRAACFCLRSTS
jgi:hypothetical protein